MLLEALEVYRYSNYVNQLKDTNRLKTKTERIKVRLTVFRNENKI